MKNADGLRALALLERAKEDMHKKKIRVVQSPAKRGTIKIAVIKKAVKHALEQRLTN